MIIPLKFNAFDNYGKEPKVKKLYNILKKSHTYVDFIPWNRKNPTHKAWYGNHEDMTPENQTKMKFLLEHIEKYTYPYDVPIGHFWFKKYEAGEWSGLHQEKSLTWIEEDNKKWWTTIILVEKSNDLVGGETVIAGDSIEGIRDKLVVSRLENIGDSMTWNSETFHGLAEVTCGRRTVLVINKPEKI